MRKKRKENERGEIAIGTNERRKTGTGEYGDDIMKDLTAYTRTLVVYKVLHSLGENIPYSGWQ